MNNASTIQQVTSNQSKDSFLPTYYHCNFLFNYTAIFGAIIHILLIILFIIIDIKELALYNLLSSISCYLIYRVNKKGYSKIAFSIGYIEVVLLSTLGIFYLGWGSGFQFFLFSTVTVLFYMPYFQKISKIIIPFASTLFYILFFNLFYNATPVYLLNSSVLNTIYYCNIIITFAMLSILANFYNIATKKTEKNCRKKIKN